MTCRVLWMITSILNCIGKSIGSQYSLRNSDVMWAYCLHCRTFDELQFWTIYILYFLHFSAFLKANTMLNIWLVEANRVSFTHHFGCVGGKLDFFLKLSYGCFRVYLIMTMLMCFILKRVRKCTVSFHQIFKSPFKALVTDGKLYILFCMNSTKML